MERVTIVGAGVIGLGIATALSGKEVFILDQNKTVRGENQSTRNPGVIHHGGHYDRAVMPLKADLCVKGNRLLYEFCRPHDVACRAAGELMVAASALEEEYLEEVFRTSVENQVPIQRLSSSEVKRLEPNVRAISALYFPTSGIVDSVALVTALACEAEQRGALLLQGNKVVGIEPHKGYFKVEVSTGLEISSFETEIVINAGGLYADELARMVNSASSYEIVPTRGEIAKFNSARRSEIGMQGLNVYPAPYVYYSDTGERAYVSLDESKHLLKEGKVTRTLGIHLSPTFDLEGKISNIITVGPAKTLGLGKQDYGSNLKQPDYFHKRVKSFFPNLKLEDVELHQTGIMAVLKNNPDWVVERDPQHPNFINVLGIDSPGLTSCLAIGEYVKSMLNPIFKLPR